MIYQERRPHPSLAPYIRCFWYARDPLAEHGLERVLPAGHMQLVISLARDYLTDCSHALRDDSSAVNLSARPSAPSLLTGMRSTYALIDRFDMAELIGVVFRPGMTAAFLPRNAALFTDRETPLEEIWGRSAEQLRERLRDGETTGTKFALIEGEFLRRLEAARAAPRPAAVSHALAALHSRDERITIREIGRRSGLSSRRLSDIFREHVGLSPKAYQRVLRFQRAVRQMHRGADVRWMELALDCGYYDQSHFVNDFREFSGISPTAYSASQRVWSNHVPLS